MAHQLPIDAAPVVLQRRVRPEDGVTHLFPAEGVGWTRSLCGELMWTAALRLPDDVATTTMHDGCVASLRTLPRVEVR